MVIGAKRSISFTSIKVNYIKCHGWSCTCTVYNYAGGSTGKWVIPTIEGAELPSRLHFSLNSVNDHQAILFGGRGPTGVFNELYIIDFCNETNTMVQQVHVLPQPGFHLVGGGHS